MRTEKEVLKDFKKLKWQISIDNDLFIDLVGSTSRKNIYCDKHIRIYKKTKSYRNTDITMQEHKLLTELFQIWKWL